VNHDLELNPARGDETFATLRYLVCAADIPEQGLSAGVGQPSVSSNLAAAFHGAAGQSRLTILRRPTQPYLGYAMTTTAIIDRDRHSVTNALGYAEARNRLAWYAQNPPQASDANLIVPADYVVGWVAASDGLISALNKLEVAANALTTIDLSFAEQALAEAITLAPSFTQGSVTELAHSLVVSTAEAIVLSHLRGLRWQALATLGYSFNDNAQAITIQAPASIDQCRHDLDRLEAQLQTESLLTGELSWLKPHAAAAIAIARTELNDRLPAGPK
jgi:hypothetical protein